MKSEFVNTTFGRAILINGEHIAEITNFGGDKNYQLSCKLFKDGFRELDADTMREAELESLQMLIDTYKRYIEIMEFLFANAKTSK